MANKNDTSDLSEFFMVSAAIIAGFLALVVFGYSLIDKKYIRFADAKISGFFEYTECQLQASPRPMFKIAESKTGSSFLDSGSFLDKADFSSVSRCSAR